MYRMLYSKAFLNGLQYRAGYFISLAGEFLRVFVQMAVWAALLASGAETTRDLRQMATYVLLNGVLGAFFLSDAGRNLGQRVISGDIAMDMIKPYSLRGYFVSQSLGQSTFHLLSRVLPVMAVLCVVCPPLPPVSPLAGLAALALSVMGCAVGLYFYYILGLWVFWLKNDWYIDWISGALLTLFGGAVVPLWMYPAWLERISRFLPFRYFRYEAIAVYLGEAAAPGTALLVEAAWLALFILLERAIWRAAQRKIFVLGG